MATKKVKKKGTKAKKRKLTPAQQVFCQVWASNGQNVAAAYREAYPNSAAKSAEANGCRLIRDDRVLTKCHELLQKRLDHYKVTGDKLVKAAAAVAFWDPKDCFDEDGRLLPIHLMPEKARLALAGMDVKALEEGQGKNREKIAELIKIKTNDRLKAVEMLMKKEGLLKEQVEVTHFDYEEFRRVRERTQQGS